MISYPNTERERVIDEIHGKKVADPYRWLENFDDPKVRAWLDEQEQCYREVLAQVPNYKKHFSRIKTLLSLGRVGVPLQTEKYLFFQKSTVEDQPILYCQDRMTKEIKEVVNPNRIPGEQPIALDWFFPSKSGKLIAYGLSTSGDEWSTLYVKRVETNELLEEQIPRTRFCSISWKKDETGFYYTRYPLPGTVPKGEENYNQHIFFHAIGTPWENDPGIFGEGYPPTNHYSIELSDDNRYLLIAVMKYTKSELYLLELKTGELKIIVENDSHLFFATIFKDNLWILTNKNSPRWSLHTTKLSAPSSPTWREIIPESEDIINEVLVLEGQLMVKVMRNASDYLKIYSKDGTLIKELSLPSSSTIYRVCSRAKISSSQFPEQYFGLSSFFIPTRIYSYNSRTMTLQVFDEIKPPITPDDFEVKKIWYRSKDGTRVSMFVAHRKGLALDGNNPTLLCGYGGFNISIKPPYLRNSRFFWLERGGVIALANLRGGSEYGEEWHKNGMLDKKQNVFDDFIAAAQWLIESGYTSPEHLAIFGRSNGGLLTGAVITQRPELFKAAYIGVPLLDMIRYHLFKIARYWIPEYGSSENKEQFDYLLAYSPYHNIRKGTAYPATMLVTAASDSRVDASHAMKMAAALQWATSSAEPVILFVEQQAGHGVGKPLKQLAKTETDFLTFLGWKTGLSLE